jgi:hypothetical protein
MDPAASDSPQPFATSDIHHEEQGQRVVSPVNQPSLAQYQAQYAGYEAYHHRSEIDNSQHDPRQQVVTARLCGSLIPRLGSTRVGDTTTVSSSPYDGAKSYVQIP